MAKGSQPQSGSGKTKFNREKKRGESWIALRDEAIKNGTWSMKKSNKSNK